MHHVAIMKKSWDLIPKIVSGEKTIESRWYQTRREPWDAIKKGDTIFFKNSGEPVIAQARVSKVLQFKLDTVSDSKSIIKRYGRQICLVNRHISAWEKIPKYCILMFLTHPKYIQTPFSISKKGFGNGAAWIRVKNIRDIQSS